MKKIIVAICISIAIIALVGCGAKTTDTPNTEEPKVETKTEEVTQYGELLWPDIGLATLIPQPDWSSNGEVAYNYENYICINVGNSTKNNLKDYAKACYDAGFNKNYSQDDTEYIAKNEAGNLLVLELKEGNVISVEVRAPIKQ